MNKIIQITVFFIVLGIGSVAICQIPAADIEEKPIVQIGIVVKDIEKSAKRLSEIFGVPSWDFFELTDHEFENVVMHDKFLGDTAKTHLRAASGMVMGYQFELLQPISGQSTHMEFFKKHGEGIHHVGIAPISNVEYTRMLDGFQKANVEVEMQADLGGSFRFSYMDTVDDLGLLFEFFTKIPEANGPNSRRYGGYSFDGTAVLDSKDLLISHIGIVVQDVRATAKRYEELLGIGPWEFHDVPISGGIMHDQPIGHNDVSVRIATATHEGLGFELIQPIEGPSTHREFLEEHGAGIHHLSFKSLTHDEAHTYDAIRKVMKKEGIGTEMRGVAFDGTVEFTYLASQNQLSGVIFEIYKQIDHLASEK